MNKPCPFCGSDKVTVTEYWVECKICGANGPIAQNEEMAWDLWNEREDAHDEKTKN